MHLIQNSYPKYIRNSKKNSIASKPTTQLGHEQTMFKDGSRNNRETHERTQTNREMKAITSARLEGLSSRNQKITVYGEDVEIKVSSFTDGGNVNWYNLYGR